jgi:hypothetical protein
MKTMIRMLPLVVLLLAPLAASPAADIAAARKADDARVVAQTTANRASMDAIFSDDLCYTHSNAAVNDKRTYLEAIASGRNAYVSIDYEKRNFTAAAPGVVLMTGVCLIKSRSGPSGPVADHHLCFLGVWRNEGGAWRFLAWQSCPVPEGKKG